MAYQNYTEEEDNQIIEAVKRHPENMRYCFYLLSKKMNRSDTSIGVRWYTHIKPNLKEPIVFVGSSKKIIPNNKIIAKNKKKTNKKFNILKSKWTRIKEILFE